MKIARDVHRQAGQADDSTFFTIQGWQGCLAAMIVAGLVGILFFIGLASFIQRHCFPTFPQRWRTLSSRVRSGWKGFVLWSARCRRRAQGRPAEHEHPNLNQNLPEDFPALSTSTLPPYSGNIHPPDYSPRRGSVFGGLIVGSYIPFSAIVSGRRPASSQHDIVLEVAPNLEEATYNVASPAMPEPAHISPSEPPPVYVVVQQQSNNHSAQSAILERTSHSIEDEWRSRRNLHE
ncbi:hypothetical protein FRB91_008000 [Serendipita sp. 411]|nr:hypothetical protein FRB91_008000 [Serendipita sp. 411]